MIVAGLAIVGIDVFFLWLIWDRMHATVGLGIGYTVFLLAVSAAAFGEMN